jgi:hypothetical protein
MAGCGSPILADSWVHRVVFDCAALQYFIRLSRCSPMLTTFGIVACDEAKKGIASCNSASRALFL